MTYVEASRLLKSTAMHGIQPGLSRMRRLLKTLGHPQKKMRVVHVAGTNGKGSVCSMVDACLRESGFRTGLFTSPHLLDATERIKINGRSISREAFAQGIEKVWKAAAGLRRTGQPVTYFEFMTALALERFSCADLDVVILETGLGGRLDSTNVILRPLVTVITNISLEHTQWLGESIEAIAGEKAGILKKGSDLVTTVRPPALKVIADRFRAVQGNRSGAKIIALSRGVDWQASSLRLVNGPQPGQEVEFKMAGRQARYFLPLLGEHQLENLACAMAVLDRLENHGIESPVAARSNGLWRLRWPGRLQMISQQPRIFLDGAHNPAGSVALAQAMPGLRKGRLGLVAGILADKDWPGILKPLLPLSDRIFLASPNDSRGLKPAQILKWMKSPIRARTTEYTSILKAFREAGRWARPTDTLLVAGSLYTVGEVLSEKPSIY